MGPLSKFSKQSKLSTLTFFSSLLALSLSLSKHVAAADKVLFVGDSIARAGSNPKHPLAFAKYFRAEFPAKKWSLNYIAAGGTALKDWTATNDGLGGENKTTIGFDAFTPDYAGWPNGSTTFQSSGSNDGSKSVRFPTLQQWTTSIKPQFIIIELGTNSQYLMRPENKAQLDKYLLRLEKQVLANGDPKKAPKIFWITPHKLPGVSSKNQDHFFQSVDTFLRARKLGVAFDGRKLVNEVSDLRAPNDPHLNEKAAKRFALGTAKAFQDFATGPLADEVPDVTAPQLRTPADHNPSR